MVVSEVQNCLTLTSRQVWPLDVKNKIQSAWRLRIMQSVRSLLEDRCPFSLYGDLCMVGKPLQLFFPNEGFYCLWKKKIRDTSALPSKAQKLIPKSGVDNMKVVRLCGSHYSWIWELPCGTQWPLASQPVPGPDHSLLTSRTHLLDQHKAEKKGRSATRDFWSSMHANSHSK